MSSIDEQIQLVEKEIRETPKHKATEHHLGKLRAKLARLKEKQLETATKKRGGGKGYSVKKQGDATVVLVGPPSAGKSTLLNKLTNAKSKVAPYAFTTVSVIPGMMNYKDAKIQVLDVPGLIEGAEEGKGRGREVLSVARGANLLILISDTERPHVLKSVSEALERNGIRINQLKPNVNIEKKIKGGIQIVSNIKQSFSKEAVKGIAKEFRITNAEITIKEKLSLNRLIDAFSKNRVYIPTIYVLNKTDLETKHCKGEYKNTMQISAEMNINLDKLKKEIWDKLKLIRVYLVRPGEKPSNKHPVIMKKGQRLADLMNVLGEEFAEDKKEAKIWGVGAKFPAQEVSLSAKLKDGMQVRFI